MDLTGKSSIGDVLSLRPTSRDGSRVLQRRCRRSILASVQEYLSTAIRTFLAISLRAPDLASAISEVSRFTLRKRPMRKLSS